MKLTRRRLLAFGLGGTALLGAGAGLRWFSSGYRLPPGQTALALSDKELVVVRAWVEAVLPPVDGVPGGLELEIHQRIDEELWAQPDEVRSDLSAAIQLIEHAPPFFGAFGRFSSLSIERRAELAGRMLVAGPAVMVQAAVALKQMTHLYYAAHPAVWKRIGYDGPWMPEPRPPASHTRYVELLAARRTQRSQA